MGQGNIVDFLQNREHVKTAVAYSAVKRTTNRYGFYLIVKQAYKF